MTVVNVKEKAKCREYNDFAPSLTARDYKDPRMIKYKCCKPSRQLQTR